MQLLPPLLASWQASSLLRVLSGHGSQPSTSSRPASAMTPVAAGRLAPGNFLLCKCTSLHGWGDFAPALGQAKQATPPRCPRHGYVQHMLSALG